MNIELHGTGRAAGALAIAAVRVGHRITSIHGRTPDAVAQLERLASPVAGRPDLRIIAVSDDAIEAVAESIAAGGRAVPTVHVSGSVGVDALASLADAPIGSFHPLMTLPDAIVGADRIPGSWIAVTADEPFAMTLDEFARSLGGHPYRLADDDKALYHAAAAASANFTLAALGLAERLYDEAGVPFAAAQPLVAAIVANAFDLGPAGALTGPIARGDAGTVERQVAAVARTGTDNDAMFRSMARATATYAQASEAVREAIG
jgi:predicted short-subunit dehydrogenase-like oxidoreductase (DUF2520 family)